MYMHTCIHVHTYVLQPVSLIGTSFTFAFWAKISWSPGAPCTFLSQRDSQGTEHLALGMICSSSSCTYHKFQADFGAADSTQWWVWDYGTSWQFYSLVVEFSSGSATGTRIQYLGTDDRCPICSWSLRAEATDPNAPNYVGSGDIYIGEGTIGNKPVWIDTLSLFTRALSKSELESVAQTHTFDRTGLVMLFRFNHQEQWAWNRYVCLCQHGRRFSAILLLPYHKIIFLHALLQPINLSMEYKKTGMPRTKGLRFLCRQL